MSKYGFNENEVRKTIITKIDKDGFNKKDVFDGNVDGGSSDFTFATMTVADDSAGFSMIAPIWLEADGESPVGVVFNTRSFKSGDVEQMLLCKGAGVYKTDSSFSNVLIVGDAEMNMNTHFLSIYGDFTIKAIGN